MNAPLCIVQSSTVRVVYRAPYQGYFPSSETALILLIAGPRANLSHCASLTPVQVCREGMSSPLEMWTLYRMYLVVCQGQIAGAAPQIRIPRVSLKVLSNLCTSLTHLLLLCAVKRALVCCVATPIHLTGGSGPLGHKLSHLNIAAFPSKHFVIC